MPKQRQHRGVHLNSSIEAMNDKDVRQCSAAVVDGLPAPRMRPFLDAADDDSDAALDLYAWNARMAGAALEQLSHLEVLLRHAIDVQLRQAARENVAGIPWFLLPPYADGRTSDAVTLVRNRLRPLNRETRDQIVAGLSFGFWTGWLGSKHEELWRHTLRRAFPHGSGRRKEISALVEQIRKFRNRIAHHDSLLSVDVGFEMGSVFRLAHIINPQAAEWMESVDRTRKVGRERPLTVNDTVVIPAARAWPFYESSHAYICQAGRYFQEVRHIAFYADRMINKDVPRIRFRRDNVLWNEGEADRLSRSNDRGDRKLSAIMRAGLDNGWTHGAYQVFALSKPGDPDHVTLDQPFVNERIGRGSGFVQRQRYTSIHQLRHASNIWEL